MAIRQALHAVPVILLTVLGNAHCASLNIRGLDPSLAEYYKQSGDSFKCLDGQRTIKYGLINDNYCDCFDGSDEPGEPLITILLESMLVHWCTMDKSALLFGCCIYPPSLRGVTADQYQYSIMYTLKKLIGDSLGRAGTSACVHGKFYCRNRGYTPQLLNASMIDDGFCGRLRLMTSVSTPPQDAGACMSLRRY